METITNGRSPAVREIKPLEQILDLFEHHLELMHLEYSYEKGEGWRQLGVGAGVVLCALCAFLFVQTAVIIGLVYAGVPLYAVCLALAAIYAALGAWLYSRGGRRDSRAGEPFQGSREELNLTFQWIRRLLS